MPLSTSAGQILAGIQVIQTPVFRDDRGYFWESYQRLRMAEAGLAEEFVQENQSFSHPNVIRGLHYQLEQPQGKLVRVTFGQIFDVAVDVRRDSPTLGGWFGIALSAGEGVQVWIPPGFAHGFMVTSTEGAAVEYMVTAFYDKASERTVRWDDPELEIGWPLTSAPPIVSEKDRAGTSFAQAELFA